MQRFSDEKLKYTGGPCPCDQSVYCVQYAVYSTLYTVQYTVYKYSNKMYALYPLLICIIYWYLIHN